MPFIYRALNHFTQPASDFQRVKFQEPQLDEEESCSLQQDLQNPNENKDLAEGRWNEDENLKFVLFVNYYQDIFSSRHQRKTCKIFRTFSEYLTGRTAAQCRSHYQKMIIKHKTIPKLRKYYKSQIGQSRFAAQYASFKNIWQSIHAPTKSSPRTRQFAECGIQTDSIPSVPSGNVCQRCSGSNSQTDVSLPSTPSFSSFMFYDYPQMQQPGMNFVYWIAPTDTLSN